MSSYPKPRDRAMPLVPEPFGSLTISRQSVFSGDTTTMAGEWCRFCPNLNIPEYSETVTEEKKTELDQRADKLSKRAICNQLYKSSEFSWEVCAWHDVFGLILDDEGLRVDKRPYEFVAEDDSGQTTVKTRIPDATFGLKTYDDYDLKRGFVCEVPDCKEDHSSKQPDRRLCKKRLYNMMHDRECGLVVDGVWGTTDIVFPFAVYEAKKRARSYEAAEDQIYHACKTYLAMLDDLVRNPENVAEYQTEESSQYQLFAFTSCGSYWEVFIAWNLFDSCTVETIWEGDVKDVNRAYDLICIVDQIHDYVINHHRTFVMKHLEAWHTRHQRLSNPSASPTPIPDITASNNKCLEDMDMSDSNLSDLDSGSDDEDTDDSVSYDFSDAVESLFGFAREKPEWFRLKYETKVYRQQRAQQTRARNRKLRDVAQAMLSGNTSEMKRGRGRPPKLDAAKKAVQKRGRGRPPKADAAKKGVQKRGRGRPPKADAAKKGVQKRGRGRPRKTNGVPKKEG